MHAQRKEVMCVQPISTLSFRAGKIELNAIRKKDLSNYDSISSLAKHNHCDFLIEKKTNKHAPDYNIYSVIARRKWINPRYVYAQEMISVHKSESKEEFLKKIFETTKRASDAAKSKTHELARSIIKK